MRHETLANEVGILDSRLLSDFETDFPDMPTLDESIRLNAYLVLSHACIEERLEAIFQDHADHLECADSLTHVSRAVASAALAWHAALGNSKYEERRLGDVMKAGSAHVAKTVAANNGIKEANVRSLAKSAGVEWPPFERQCFDELAKLDTLGAKRGSVAHVSASNTQITQGAIYPEDARKWVADAIDAALAVETYLAESRV